MSERVPVTLLSGFLGSGKTTMINYVLAQPSGLRIAVIVNEFGDLGIDGALISGEASGLIELRGGCVCCVNRGDLGRAVTELVSSGRPIDHILVEASGLTDPGPTIDLLTGSALMDKVAFAGTVSLIDAVNFDRNLEYAEAAHNQITYADLLVINKSDLMDETTVETISAGLRRLNQDAPIVSATNSVIPIEVILGQKEWDFARSGTAAHGYDGNHQFTAVTLTASGALDLEKLTAWLANLPASVLRAKGIVRGENADVASAVQSVAGRISISEIPGGRALPTDRSVLVLIGTSIGGPAERARLERELIACTV